MTQAINVPNARTPVWEKNQDGAPVFTRPWFLFFQYLFTRSGGTIAPDGPADVSEVRAELQQLPALQSVVTSDPIGFEPAGLLDRIAVLSTQIDDINQGPP